MSTLEELGARRVDALAPKDVKRGATRSQLILASGYAARLLLSIGITAVVGRATSREDFGFFTLVFSIFFIAHVVLNLGTGSLAVREIARDPERERPLLEGLFAWRRMAGAVLGALVAGIGLFESDPSRRLALIGCGVACALMAPTALTPVFVVRQRMGGPALVRTVNQGVTLALAFVLRVAGAAGVWYAWLHVVRELSNTLGIRALALRLLGYRPKPGWKDRGLAAFVRMSAYQGLAALFQTGAFHVDVFLVRGLRGEDELGAYAAAFRPIQPLLLLPTLLLVPLLPVFAVHAREDRGRFGGIVRKSTLGLLGIGAVVGVVGILGAPLVLELLFGGTYLEGEFAAVASFRWLTLALCASFGAGALSTALLADRGEKLLAWIHALAFLTNVVLNVALIPRFGFEAAAATTAATELLVALVLAVVIVRRVRVRTTRPAAE